MANGKWKGLEPEFALLGATLKQAVRDARQSRNPALQIEAFEFLQNCAPTVAGKVKKSIRIDFLSCEREQLMAAWHDLIQRVEALEERGLTVATEYHGQGLPKWLLPALGDCDVFLLNAKNVPTDSTLCIVRLSELEKLMAKAKGELNECKNERL